MKTKQVFNLAAILVVLTLLVVVKQSQKPKELSTQEYAPLDLSFKPDAVAKIDISRPKGNQEEYVDIQRAGSGWKLKSILDARADSEKVGLFLKEIQSAKGEVRARSKSLFKDFGIGDNEAYRVKLQDSHGKNLLDIKIGTKKAGGQGFFVRKSDSDIVHLTDALLMDRMGIFGDPKSESVDHDFWAAKNLIDLNADEIMKIEAKRFQKGHEILTAGLVKEKSRWKFMRPGPFQPDPEKIKSFVNSFKTWTAQRVLDPHEKGKDFGFDQPQWQMTFTPEQGEPVVVTAGKAEGKKPVYLKVTNEPVIFQMSPYYYENMDADDGRFFPQNFLGVDDKVSVLVVHADKKEWTLHPQQKKWDGLNRYLEDLKNFYPSKLLLDEVQKRKVRDKGKYWIEIVKDNQTTALDFGDKISDSEIAAALRGTGLYFAVPQTSLQQFFEETTRLQEPAPPPPAESKKKEEVRSRT